VAEHILGKDATWFRLPVEAPHLQRGNEMAIEIKAPNDFSQIKPHRTIFLGGVIDQGSAPDWQKAIVEVLEPCKDIFILNPRRDVWDPTWDQSTDNPKFVEQVNWELDAQENSGLIIYVFAPDEDSAKTAKAPITLLELGLFIQDADVLVVCPKGYYRKGNVDIVCRRHSATVFENLDELIEFLHENVV
jgi:Nucleoside 2-deoxyribosyltransferase like